jgi:hypothetical protein
MEKIRKSFDKTRERRRFEPVTNSLEDLSDVYSFTSQSLSSTMSPALNPFKGYYNYNFNYRLDPVHFSPYSYLFGKSLSINLNLNDKSQFINRNKNKNDKISKAVVLKKKITKKVNRRNENHHKFSYLLEEKNDEETNDLEDTFKEYDKKIIFYEINNYSPAVIQTIPFSNYYDNFFSSKQSSLKRSKSATFEYTQKNETVFSSENSNSINTPDNFVKTKNGDDMNDRFFFSYSLTLGFVYIFL